MVWPVQPLSSSSRHRSHFGIALSSRNGTGDLEETDDESSSNKEPGRRQGVCLDGPSLCSHRRLRLGEFMTLWSSQPSSWRMAWMELEVIDSVSESWEMCQWPWPMESPS